MVKRGEVLRLVVKYLRAAAGLTQEEFARDLGLAQSTISDYERGVVSVPGDVLRRMAAAAGVPWPVVASLRRFYAAALSLAARGGAGGTGSAGGTGGTGDGASVPPLVQEIVDAALLAMAPYWIEEEEREAAAAPTAADRLAEAQEAWEALATFSPERRRRLIELSPNLSGNCALARVICDASESAATAEGTAADQARELADLALAIAQRVRGKAERARTEGFCRAYLANALRVATDLEAADAELGRAWKCWQEGGKAETAILPPWRLHELEATLRREQRRFPAALASVDWALALCGSEPEARILLQKDQILAAMGDRQAL